VRDRGCARNGAALAPSTRRSASWAVPASDGEDVPVIALDNLLDDGKVSAPANF